MMNSVTPISPTPPSLVSLLRERLEGRLHELGEKIPPLNPRSDPGQIHDIRVATRRQRALCRLLQFSDLEKPLRKLAKSLSLVRSWDVSFQRLKGLEREWRSENHQGLGFLRKIFKNQARRSRQKVLKNFNRKKFFRALDSGKLNLPWDSFSSTELEQKIHDGSGRASVVVLNKWRDYQKDFSIPRFHQVRIALKKLRYLLEIQIDCLGYPDAAVLEQLKKLQDHLGYIHDLMVLRDHLKEKGIRKKVPSGKKERYHRVQKCLKKSIAAGLEDFQKHDGVRLPSVLEGRLP